jgi:hypothetical protein
VLANHGGHDHVLPLASPSPDRPGARLTPDKALFALRE